VDQELVEYLDRRFNEFRVEFRNDLRNELAASVAEIIAETRRHFDVVAERLMDKIQLVGEGVIGVDQKVDRLAAETRTGFQKVDRRILHLQARVIGRN
jgi:hypothetical protein